LHFLERSKEKEKENGMDEIDGLGQLTDYRRLCSDLTLQTKKEGFFKVYKWLDRYKEYIFFFLNFTLCTFSLRNVNVIRISHSKWAAALYILSMGFYTTDCNNLDSFNFDPPLTNSNRHGIKKN
jgi:hypothetical protein